MAQSNEGGFGSPFIRASFNGTEVTAIIKEFEYIYDEEGDDICTIIIESDNRNEPDNDYYKNGAEWNITWGYIAAEISEVRTIYIRDVEWNFDKTTIKGTILATEKGITLKFEDEETNYQNMTLADMVQDKATKHGLEAWLDATGYDKLPELILPSQAGDYNLSDYFKRNTNAIVDRDYKQMNSPSNRVNLARQIRAMGAADSANRAQQKSFQGFTVTPAALGTEVQDGPGGSEGAVVWHFKKIDNAPQAGDTDSQFLDKYAQKEPGGPFIIDTRDGDITLMKRNFNQVPFKAYEYGGTEGELLDFKPMSRIRSHKKASTNVGFKGWDPVNKTTYSGNANSIYDGDDTLVQYRKVYRFLKELSSVKGVNGDPGLGTRTWSTKMLRTLATSGQLGDPTQVSRVDASSNNVTDAVYIPYTVNDALAMLKKSLVDAEKTIDNSTLDPTQEDAQASYDRAMNERRRQELKMNPASATVWGNPQLKVGQIITILSVSKKYSGNYYITKCSHKLSKSGFLTTLQMVTQGYNLPVGKEWSKVKFGRINKIKGDLNPTYKIKLATISNP